MKRWISSLMAAVLCLSLAVAPASAYVRVDTTEKVSLILTYTYDQKAVEGLNISIYKVYDMSDAVRFTVEKSFETAYGTDGPNGAQKEMSFTLSDWPIKDEEGNVVDADQVDWAGMATTLGGLLQRDIANETVKVQPLLTKPTDADGKVTFESTQTVTMDPGLYLVMGEAKVDGRSTYTPQTFLLSLPHLNEDDTWSYGLAASGKLSYYYDPPSGGSTHSVTVVKNWVDEDAEDVTRPASIQVQLLRNGQAYDTVTLNEANGWQYTWNRLSDSAQWTVVEASVPEGYTMELSQTGNDFVITNTADTELEDEEPPLGPGPGEEGEDPGDLPEVDLDDEDVPMGNLPQTGTLWWPVPFLTMGGLVLLSLAWLDSRRNRRES